MSTTTQRLKTKFGGKIIPFSVSQFIILCGLLSKHPCSTHTRIILNFLCVSGPNSLAFRKQHVDLLQFYARTNFLARGRVGSKLRKFLSLRPTVTSSLLKDFSETLRL